MQTQAVAQRSACWGGVDTWGEGAGAAEWGDWLGMKKPPDGGMKALVEVQQFRKLEKKTSAEAEAEFCLVDKQKGLHKVDEVVGYCEVCKASTQHD
jgi:hypothetical protein